jgi:small subunit ribosomal protein S6
MKRYESVVILGPDVSDDDIRTFTERYSKLIKQTGGEIIKIEDWGFKKLAYKINRKDKGRFILLDYVGLPALLNEMERQFKISEEVIRFLSIKTDDNVDLEAFKAQAAAEEKAPEALPAQPAESPVAAEAEQTPETAEPSAESTEAPVAEMTAASSPDERAPAPEPQRQPAEEDEKEGQQ